MGFYSHKNSWFEKQLNERLAVVAMWDKKKILNVSVKGKGGCAGNVLLQSGFRFSG